MKPFFLAFLLACSGAGAGGSCFGDEPAKAAEVETLYLHCFSPTTGQRIVYDDSPPYNGKPPRPPAAIVTVKALVGTPFEAKVGEHGSVSGRIDPKGAGGVGREALGGGDGAFKAKHRAPQGGSGEGEEAGVTKRRRIWRER
jgi:hypothetical protein